MAADDIDRRIRVFVSSTFRDMQAERDMLVKKIFPQLRKICNERSVTWGEVDLRWGITIEDAAEGRILPICLELVDRCRPYFIGLLGERYGSRAQPLPPDLIARNGWLVEHASKSNTELEIIHAVLRDQTMRGHAYFYFRDPRYAAQIPKPQQSDFLSEDHASAAELDRLKHSLRQAAGNGLCHLREKYATVEELGDWILQDFSRLIDQLFPRDSVPDLLTQERARHAAYARDRRRAFVGRGTILQQMDNWAVAGSRPMVITGVPGCGKTALLAEWADRWGRQHPDDLIIQHYIGSTPDSAHWHRLVIRLLAEIKSAFALEDPLPTQLEALTNALRPWTLKATGAKRVILVLDGLNQLADEGSARQLGWLPSAWPPNFRLLASTLEGDSLDALREQSEIESIPLFTREQIPLAIQAFFQPFGERKLPKETQELLVNTPAALNPLFLRSVLDELRQFGDHDRLPEKAVEYLAAPDLPALFDRILTRWDQDFGHDANFPNLVRRALGLIVSARFGLSEIELLELLGATDSQGHPAPLPQRIWAPFYLAAENALTQRAGQLNLGHEYLRQAVVRKWLQPPEAFAELRIVLADYFSGRPPIESRVWEELPWALRHLQNWPRLKEYLRDLRVFVALSEVRPEDLHDYWCDLERHFDPVDVYLGQLVGLETPPLSTWDLVVVFSQLTEFFFNRGNPGAARSLMVELTKALEKTEALHSDATLASLTNLAHLFNQLGDYTEAARLYRRVFASHEQKHGFEDRRTLCAANNLGLTLMYLSEPQEAETLLRQALEAKTRLWGEDDLSTLNTANNLGGLLMAIRAFSEAEQWYRAVLDQRRRILGPKAAMTLQSLDNLGSLLIEMGQFAEARDVLQNCLDVYLELWGDRHLDTLTCQNNFAALHLSEGHVHEARELFYQVFEKSFGLLGLHHPKCQSLQNALNYCDQVIADMDGANGDAPLKDLTVFAALIWQAKEHVRYSILMDGRPLPTVLPTVQEVLADRKLTQDKTEIQAALNVTRQLIALAPNRYLPWKYRTLALVNARQFTHALDALERALPLRKQSDPDLNKLKEVLITLTSGEGHSTGGAARQF